VLSWRLKKIASYLEYSYNATRGLFVFLRFGMSNAFVMLSCGVACSSIGAVHGSVSASGSSSVGTVHGSIAAGGSSSIGAVHGSVAASGNDISSAVRLVNWHVNVEGFATQFCKGFNKLCGLLRGDSIVEIVQKKT
jgi:hypothetical protein